MTTSGDAAMCAHCDGSVPHRHGPGPRSAGALRRQRRALTAWAGVRAALLLGVAAVVASVWSGEGDAGTRPALLIALGAGAWVLAMLTALLVAGSLHRPEREGTARPALALGAVASAAVTPLLALAVVLAAGPGPWWRVAVGAGAGWLAAALTADVVAALRVRTLVGGGDRRAEQARIASAGGPADHARHLAGSTGGAVVFAASTAALGILPVLVVVLVPLSAAVAAYVARARTASPSTRREATLRG